MHEKPIPQLHYDWEVSIEEHENALAFPEEDDKETQFLFPVPN